MVTQYGMSEKFGLMGLESQENQYLTGRSVLNCGDATAAEIDQEVMKILKASYEEAIRLLKDNRDVMDQIADFLIEKETITGKEFMKIFRKVKGLPEPAEETPESQDGKAQPNQDKGDGNPAERPAPSGSISPAEQPSPSDSGSPAERPAPLDSGSPAEQPSPRVREIRQAGLGRRIGKALRNLSGLPGRPAGMRAARTGTGNMR